MISRFLRTASAYFADTPPSQCWPVPTDKAREKSHPRRTEIRVRIICSLLPAKEHQTHSTMKSSTTNKPWGSEFQRTNPSFKAATTTTPNIKSHEKAEEGEEGLRKQGAKKHQTGATAGKSVDRKAARKNLVTKVEYTGRRTDLKPFAASFFAPHLFQGEHRHLIGCGAGALALLTGVPPEKIAARHRGRHYSDKFMIRFLKQRSFRLLRLTPLRITSARNGVGSEHVILISQLFRNYEATWGIIHANVYYHSFQAYNLSELAFLNKPILSAYLVIHPSWRISEDFVLTPQLRRISGPKFKVSHLRKGAEFSGLRKWA